MIKHFTIFISTLLIASCGYKDSEKITDEQKLIGQMIELVRSQLIINF